MMYSLTTFVKGMVTHWLTTLLLLIAAAALAMFVGSLFMLFYVQLDTWSGDVEREEIESSRHVHKE